MPDASGQVPGVCATRPSALMTGAPGPVPVHKTPETSQIVTASSRSHNSEENIVKWWYAALKGESQAKIQLKIFVCIGQFDDEGNSSSNRGAVVSHNHHRSHCTINELKIRELWYRVHLHVENV